MLHLIFILHRSNIAVKNLEDILLKSVGPALVLDPRLYKALFSCLLAFAREIKSGGGGINLIRAWDFLTTPSYPHHFLSCAQATNCN